jgi:hypothetical protein
VKPVAGLRRFALFLYDFVVGDDWRVAVGVALALGLTAALTHLAHVAAWWTMPVAVGAVLVGSLARATRPRRRG